ncbi:MAG: hypothetical protein IJD92_04570 [Bacilli bacterium]|nr:hypothetical protein [Bacilli bacterium]
MSYCVNCGVKLAKSEKKCPLCNTKVINPNLKDEVSYSVYSNQIEKFKSVDFKFLVKICYFVLFVLALVTVLCNIIITHSVTWSIYVVFSIICFGSLLSYLNFKSVYISHTLAFVGIELLLFVIAYLNSGMHWFIYLVLPFIFILWIYVMLCTFLIKKRRKSLIRSIVLCLVVSSVAIIGIESSIDLFKYEKISLTWSLYAILPILIISILLFLISYNKKLLDEIKQRLFI